MSREPGNAAPYFAVGGAFGERAGEPSSIGDGIIGRLGDISRDDVRRRGPVVRKFVDRLAP